MMQWRVEQRAHTEAEPQLDGARRGALRDGGEREEGHQRGERQRQHAEVDALRLAAGLAERRDGAARQDE